MSLARRHTVQELCRNRRPPTPSPRLNPLPLVASGKIRFLCRPGAQCSRPRFSGESLFCWNSTDRPQLPVHASTPRHTPGLPSTLPASPLTKQASFPWITSSTQEGGDAKTYQIDFMDRRVPRQHCSPSTPSDAKFLFKMYDYAVLRQVP